MKASSLQGHALLLFNLQAPAPSQKPVFPKSPWERSSGWAKSQCLGTQRGGKALETSLGIKLGTYMDSEGGLVSARKRGRERHSLSVSVTARLNLR